MKSRGGGTNINLDIIRAGNFYWRKSYFIGGVHNFIGENIFLLAKSPELLAKMKIYWRTGNFEGFFPVRQWLLYFEIPA
ncbi:hypothetical protein QNH36_05405 [Mesobacillus sp. AQ2]|uniref:hypothetical protein n=1 Tax=Bacillaceae TaxID=186817 RepID=UPI0011A0FCDE|nr:MULTISPECIES: hypothetical protein [Bacillaceae]WHX41593.1 hypothetical protein QNH36_05405 [Mesobacillus sp. AQ2]